MRKTFKEKKGVITNPYIGFTSFQHFRYDPLYSDCIAGRCEFAGCETENYECYPIPEGVEEKGAEQGFHPDTTVAYIRFLWKEFEPKQGEYNYAFMEEILKKAEACGQTVMFRLLPHSTCERDDVPDWLKELIPCPARPRGMRVKDSPTHPLYLKLFAKAVEKIGERFDSYDVLDCVDISLGGSWGEGSQAYSDEETRTLMDLYVRVFPNTKLLGQYSNTPMLSYISEKRAIGWRADGTGSPKHMTGAFPRNIEKMEREYWKTGPVSFESYWWLTEWDRHGWDIDDIIEKTLSWHISTFNNKSFPIPHKWKDKIDAWLEKMGYRFVYRALEYPDTFPAGKTVPLTLTVENAGVAPIYNKLPFSLSLWKEDGTCVLDVETDADITGWLPGTHEVPLALSIPKHLPQGTYTLAAAIGGKRGTPTVTPAIEAPAYGGAFALTSVTVV